jgi:hypothetical protein
MLCELRHECKSEYLLVLILLDNFAFFLRMILWGVDDPERLIHVILFAGMCVVDQEDRRGQAGDPATDDVSSLLADALLAAELGDALLAAQAFEHDADLLLGRKVAPGEWWA